MTTAVVTHCGLDAVGHRVHVEANLLNRHRLQCWVAVERLVEIRHIRVVMLGAMDVHRERIDGWFECVFGVWKFWKREGHGCFFLRKWVKWRESVGDR